MFFQVSIGDETLLKFSGVPLGEACSVVLRGATEQIIGEADRSLHDALCVLTSTVKEPRTVYGGGCSEMLMAKAVEELAAKTAGKEAKVIISDCFNFLNKSQSFLHVGYGSICQCSKTTSQYHC